MSSTNSSLSSVDAAYAGNAARAQAEFEKARSSWDEVSLAISTREARGPQLLFGSLQTKLKSGAPAVEVNSTVYVTLEELSEDIAAELSRSAVHWGFCSSRVASLSWAWPGRDQDSHCWRSLRRHCCLWEITSAEIPPAP